MEFHKTSKSFIGCFENNIDFQGNDWSGNEFSKIPYAEVCREKCVEDSRCKVFTYVKEKQICWLKKSDAGRRTMDGYVSGRKDCPGSSNSSSKRGGLAQFF